MNIEIDEELAKLGAHQLYNSNQDLKSYVSNGIKNMKKIDSYYKETDNFHFNWVFSSPNGNIYYSDLYMMLKYIMLLWMKDHLAGIKDEFYSVRLLNKDSRRQAA